MTVGMIGLAFSNRRRRARRFEEQEAKITLFPLLMAEADRRKLLAMKRLRDEEAIIMKDVPGWVVGESVYNSERWVWPSYDDFYNLLRSKDRYRKIHEYYMYV